MIERKELLNFNFYKKSPFTGSYHGMRYRLEEIKGEEASTLRATTYPQPYCFTATEESEKTSAEFDFSEEGLEEACVWLNEQYIATPDRWANHKRF